MSRGVPQVQFVLPELDRWHRVLLAVLFGAYVLELVLQAAGVPLYQWLPWWGFEGGAFRPWQPLTRFLVQGATRSAVVDVLMSLMVLYFFLPTLELVLDRAQLAKAVASGVVVGTALPFLVDLTGALGGSPALGWTSLVFALPALFGLARPEQDILLLVFPVKAKWFLWGSLLVALLYILAEPSLDTFQGLGVWLGVYGWWHGLGPGSRRRQLLAKSRKVERELSRFQVIDGGKSRPQGDQGDEWVH